MKTPQPNSKSCFVCGVENPAGLHLHFYNSAPGEVTAEISVPECYQGYPGVVHGGVVAAMLDEVSGRAMMGDPEKPRFMFTGRLNIHYHKNVPTGQPLKLVGRAGADKGHAAIATGAIYNQAGELLAEAEALLVNVPEEMVAQRDLESFGWQVYPDETSAQA